MKIINNIDCGNSNISEDGAIKVIQGLRDFTDQRKRCSKYSACKYLNMSRATFDNYVRMGKIPEGQHEVGFKEKSWRISNLNKFIEQSRRSRGEDSFTAGDDVKKH